MRKYSSRHVERFVTSCIKKFVTEKEQAESARKQQTEKELQRRNFKETAQRRYIEEQQRLYNEANARVVARLEAGAAGEQFCIYWGDQVKDSTIPASREHSASRSKLRGMVGKSKYDMKYRLPAVTSEVSTQLADVPPAISGLLSSRGTAGIAPTALVSAVGTISSPITADISADL